MCSLMGNDDLWTRRLIPKPLDPRRHHPETQVSLCLTPSPSRSCPSSRLGTLPRWKSSQTPPTLVVTISTLPAISATGWVMQFVVVSDPPLISGYHRTKNSSGHSSFQYLYTWLAVTYPAAYCKSSTRTAFTSWFALSVGIQWRPRWVDSWPSSNAAVVSL